MIALSGGQPDQLMMLVREAIVAREFPITNDSLNRAEREGKRSSPGCCAQDHWPIINEVRLNGRFQRTEEKEKAFRELLQSRAILQYVNADEWYGLNPMVAALKPPAKVK